MKALSYILNKMAPFLLIGMVAGAILGLSKKHNPELLSYFKYLGAFIFGVAFLVYSYWSYSRPETNYQWSLLERLGILVSGIAALIMCLRLSTDFLKGSIIMYAIISFSLAFIGRPILEHYGTRNKHS